MDCTGTTIRPSPISLVSSAFPQVETPERLVKRQVDPRKEDRKIDFDERYCVAETIRNGEAALPRVSFRKRPPRYETTTKSWGKGHGQTSCETVVWYGHSRVVLRPDEGFSYPSCREKVSEGMPDIKHLRLMFKCSITVVQARYLDANVPRRQIYLMLLSTAW